MRSIEVEALSKHYGSTVAIDGISFSVEPGEVVGFLGPNGAGKTTTMKILAGVTEVRSAAGEGPGTADYTIYGASGSDLRPSVFRAAADGAGTLLELRRQSAGLEGVFRDLTAEE